MSIDRGPPRLPSDYGASYWLDRSRGALRRGRPEWRFWLIAAHSSGHDSGGSEMELAE